MEELQKLYDVLVREGKYTKSFEEFQSRWGNDQAYKDQVFDVVSRDGLYTQDRDSFFQKYSGAAMPTAQDLKKKAVPNKSLVPNAQQPQQEDPFATESNSEDGSSVSNIPKFNLKDLRQPMPTMAQDATYVKKQPALMLTKEEAAKRAAEKARADKMRAKEFSALQVQEKQKQLQLDKNAKLENTNLRKSPEFNQLLSSVDNKLTGKTEEEVVPELNRKFGKYGFTFEQSRAGRDYVIARTLDGKRSIEVSLDNFTDSGDVEESSKLRQFINSNSRAPYEDVQRDFLSNAQRAQNLRSKPLRNDDGTESTVRFTSFEEDGKYKVIPTLFPKDPNNYTSRKDSWMELPFDKALKVANQRGEVFTFKTKQEAENFAKGSWKDANTIDLEADKFYKERGRDYITDKKRFDKLNELNTIIDFVEDNKIGKGTAEEKLLKKQHPELFVRGSFRPDIAQQVDKLKTQRDILDEQVNDYGFFNQKGTAEDTRMEFDSYLAKRQKEIAGKAVKMNNEAKAMADSLDVISLQKFGLPIKDLMKYKDTNPATKNEFKELQDAYYDAQIKKKAAANKFENAKTYYNAKVNKEIQNTFEDNLSGFWNATTDAYNNGLIGQQLLSFSMGGGRLEKWDREVAAKKIADRYSELSGTESKVMARLNSKEGVDWWKALADDPIEGISTLVSTSISQMLPYGSKIVAGSVATGATTGAIIGGTATPEFGGVGAVPGAITGAGYGLRTGMALTNLAAEYTNAVMEAVKTKGYNPLDPESLEKALQDESVWEEGKKVGLTRGVPIAVADYLTAGLAGRIFKPTSLLASTGKKLAYGGAERLAFDPLAEAAGELAAQGSEIALGTGRENLEWKEIAMEGLGGFGSNTINYAYNAYSDSRNKNNVDIAKNLSDINIIAHESASDEKISTWANNMQQLGKIDADVNQRIQENIGLRRDAREALTVGNNKKVSNPVLSRTMELMSAREELSSSTNRREIYRDKIRAINDELSVIGETKSLVPAEKAVNLDTVIGASREGVGEYLIDGIRYTKEQFLEKVNGFNEKRLGRAVLGVKNDSETANVIKQKYDAIQKQTTNESLLGTEESELGLQGVGEENTQPQVVATGTEVITDEKSQEIGAQIKDLVDTFKLTLNVDSGIEDETSTEAIQKLSDFFGVDFGDRTNPEQSVKQDALINLQSMLDATSTAPEIGGLFSDVNEMMIAYKEDKAQGIASPVVKSIDAVLGITPEVTAEVSVQENEKEIETLRAQEQAELMEAIPNAANYIVDGKVDREKITDPADLEIFDKIYNKYDELITPLLTEVSSKTPTNTTEQNGQQPNTTATSGPNAGNRLFNKPLKGAAEIANKYYERVFGRPRPKYYGSRGLDEARAKRIADAFIAMKHDPNNPEVRAAYDALAKETIDQYQAFLDAGYVVEIDNEEPYANSQGMIDDLRDNKRIKIFSTESGFGDTPITDEQRADNPLLRETEFTDVNGQPMLVNDLFRAIHDFYGHAELGNSFGPKGEENAWQIHSRMFSPLARRAMTTETRGQNSFVNFSGINDRITALREEARKLREQGDEQGAQAIVERIYEEGKFADQKIGLLPEEFSEIDEADQGDVNMQPEGLQVRDQAALVQSLVDEQAEESQSPNYKYTDLYNQDPRLAALEQEKESLAFVSSQEFVDAMVEVGDSMESITQYQQESINKFNESIKALEESLAQNPPAEVVVEETTTEVEQTQPTAEQPAPKPTPAKRGAAPSTVSKLTTNAIKALKTVFPDVPVKVFKNQQELTDFVKAQLGAAAAKRVGNVRGIIYFKSIGQPRFILLNEAAASPTTLPHEIWHALLGKAFGNNPQLFRNFRKAIDKTLRQNGHGDIADRLTEYADQPYYKRRGESAEEWLVQLGAYLTNAGFKPEQMNARDRNLLNSIKEIVNKFTKKMLGVPLFLEDAKPSDVLEFMTNISDSLRRGEDLNQYFKGSKLEEMSNQQIEDTFKAEVNEESPEQLMSKLSAMAQVANKLGKDSSRTFVSLIKELTSSEAYKNADDIQKEKMYREVRKMMGLKEKSAPSVSRLKEGPIEGDENLSPFKRFFGKVKRDGKVTMTEKKLLIKQIKDLARGARDAKAAWVKISNELSKGIKLIESSGSITDKQAKNIIRKFSGVNMFSEKSINRFIDYMGNVFAKADYAEKFSFAKNTKKDISKLAKNKDKNANLRDMASEFIKIDPAMVSDIEAYNEMASKIKEALIGSTLRGTTVKFAETVNIAEATEYIKKTLVAQDKALLQETIDEIQELMGVDASKFSYDEMMALLESDEPITKYNEEIIRNTINKMFNVYSTIIKETVRSGKDLFTDEDVEFTKKQKDLVAKFMDMDLSLLKPREALQAVDALNNFLTNHSTAKMQAVLSDYTGKKNAKLIRQKGIAAQSLKKYWSKGLGRFLGEQTTNLNILFERMFKGVKRGGLVEDYSGMTDLRNGKAFAQTQANNIVNDYVNTFYDKKANGEAFNTDYNNTERGIAAFMIRNVIGNEAEMAIEFNRRKDLIEESIEVLSVGTDIERKRAELYQRAYDKVVDGSENIKDIKKKLDPTNAQAIEWWSKQWSDKYEELSDVSENIYNKVLDKDINYTPDRFAKLASDSGQVELANDDSAFHHNNGALYKNATGVLMTAVKPKKLPTDKSGQTTRFIDLSFDKTNSNAMYDALVDINTAAPVRQVESFLNSPDYKYIVPQAEDAKILKDRIQLYVRNIRNKNPYTNDELSATVRRLNKIAAVGVGQALGGVFQPIKQVVPVALNTLVNAGSIDVRSQFNQDKMNFLNNSGFAIANRGIESQAQIESINKLIDLAAQSKGAKALGYLEEANKKWLEIFLVKPDVFVARASWMSYYEQALKKQGIDPNTIDYSKHEVNAEAGNYAQRMVDRQQNVSDADLSGKLFANRESSNQLMLKMLMAFASFRMNQSARLGSDLAVMNDKTATKEDKTIAARSLAGYGVEAVMFRVVSAASILALGTVAKWAMGKEEDDEDFKKRFDSVVKGQMTGLTTDVFSPLPIVDKGVQWGVSNTLETVQNAFDVAKEDQINIYGVSKQTALQNLGMYGISLERGLQFLEMVELATKGTYTDDRGEKKQISEEDKEALRLLIGPALLTNVGLAPSEINTIVRSAVKDSKKAYKSPEEKAAAAERMMEAEETRDEKAEALEKIKEFAQTQEEVDYIDGKIDELYYTKEEKKILKEERKEEKAYKEELLYDEENDVEYDNETDMKRYNPRLYNERFGQGSEWYEEHKAEKKVDKLMNKEIRKMEDEEFGYVAPAKKTKKRNSDGSVKRSKRVSSGSGGRSTVNSTTTDAFGNVIRTYSKRPKQ